MTLREKIHSESEVSVLRDGNVIVKSSADLVVRRNIHINSTYL